MSPVHCCMSWFPGPEGRTLPPGPLRALYAASTQYVAVAEQLASLLDKFVGSKGSSLWKAGE
jgi:hypothetical protein